MSVSVNYDRFGQAVIYLLALPTELTGHIAFLQATLSSRLEETNESKFETEKPPEIHRIESCAHFKLE